MRTKCLQINAEKPTRLPRDNDLFFTVINKMTLRVHATPHPRIVYLTLLNSLFFANLGINMIAKSRGRYAHHGQQRRPPNFGPPATHR